MGYAVAIQWWRVGEEHQHGRKHYEAIHFDLVHFQSHFV